MELSLEEGFGRNETFKMSMKNSGSIIYQWYTVVLSISIIICCGIYQHQTGNIILLLLSLLALFPVHMCILMCVFTCLLLPFMENRFIQLMMTLITYCSSNITMLVLSILYYLDNHNVLVLAIAIQNAVHILFNLIAVIRELKSTDW